MYFAVVLTATKTKLVIPIQWFESFDLVQIFQRGMVNKSKVYKIFYDSDFNKDPNFRLPIQNEFNENGPNPSACYFASVLQCFGKFRHITICRSIDCIMYKII